MTCSIDKVVSVTGVLCAALVFYGTYQLVQFFSLYKTDSYYKGISMAAPVNNIQDIIALFPKTVAEIQVNTAQAMYDAKQKINSLIALKKEERIFTNTAKALDAIEALSSFSILFNTVYILEMVSPDEALRTAAHEAISKMQEFSVDELANNQALYYALKDYVDTDALQEKLTEKQRYYLQETMDAFKRNGLDLPAQKRSKVKQLQKDIALNSRIFDTNIASDQTKVTLTEDELVGLDPSFIENLARDAAGNYLLGVDYPTYFHVMENCAHEQARKKMFVAFNNRAYPANDDILRTVIAKRNQVAQELGFASYAAFDLDNEMVETPARAYEFLTSLLAQVDKKVAQEIAQLIADLPPSVTLSPEEKIKPWDSAFIKNQYKKKYLAIDERKIAEYFPLEKTIQGLLSIYEQFFSIRFKQVPVSGAWHEQVTGIEVYDVTTDELLGYFLLDLYPRANKYSHACHITIIPATYDDQGRANKAASLVIANFPQATATRPALLERHYVKTFFHEFGHALHALFGRTQMASFAGTNVKRDFVEMPSQMLEEWLADKDILKMVSSHYLTGEPLSDDLIEKIIRLKHFDSGTFVQQQSYYALMALELFGAGADKDPYAVMRELYQSLFPYKLFSEQDHMYASFGHLMGYGAKYYGYLWSKVFALDLFDEIKKHGLLNPSIGQHYKDTVLSQGGSQDPNELLQAFLGRKPSKQAFVQDLGLS